MAKKRKKATPLMPPGKSTMVVEYGRVSTDAPTLARFGSSVGNNRLNVLRSSNGTSWRDKRTLKGTTTSGPALCVLGKRLLLGWRGVGSNMLNITQSTNGTSFSGKGTLGETTTSRPALLGAGSTAYLAWEGVGNRRLNVLQSKSGWTWTGTNAAHNLNTLLHSLA